jgi:hypothetical protein
MCIYIYIFIYIYAYISIDRKSFLNDICKVEDPVLEIYICIYVCIRVYLSVCIHIYIYNRQRSHLVFETNGC